MTPRGVALDDPRNAAALACLKPPVITAAAVRQRLSRADRGRPPTDLDDKVARLMSRPAGPEPPASEPWQSITDPFQQIRAHPDLVARLWRLNDGLPSDCRWVIYRNPALVHPDNGVIFGFAFGTIGYALNLPAACAIEADRAGARSRRAIPGAAPHDLAVIGPSWRFGRWFDSESEWCRAAFEATGME